MIDLRKIAIWPEGGGAAPVPPVPPGPPAPSSGLPIRFLDYDGTLLHSYTAEDFAALAELPANPDRAGLTAQGWNYSLEDAQAFVAKYGRIDIGQTYITDDGKTRIYIRLEEGRTSPVLQFFATAGATVVVDWGDGASEDLTGNGMSTLTSKQHDYAAAGDYVIAIELAVEGEISFEGDYYGAYLLRFSSGAWDNRSYAYLNSIQRVEIGNNINIGSSAFKKCTSLISIVIPKGVSITGSGAFYECYSLASAVFPEGTLRINGSTFHSCYSLASVVIPKGVSIISGYAFYWCYALSSVVLPESVTSMGEYLFERCYSLASIVIPEGPTNIGSSAFVDCYSLSSVVIPEGVKIILGNAFRGCYSLASVLLPKSITEIYSNAFSSCYSLVSVVIPEGITNIASSAFQSLQSLSILTVEANTPPTLNSSALSGAPADMKIYVPAESVDAYKAATNWSAYADRIFPIPGTEVADTDTTDPN